jgi:hypothetical protein
MILCYIYHACSVPSNQKAQSCVDTMLVSTSGLARVFTTTGSSLRNPKNGGERKRWTGRTSLKQ